MLNKLTIREIHKGIKNKQFSFLEVLNSYKNNFEKYQAINMHISTYWDRATKQAQELDKLQNYDFDKYPLLGIPIAVKDNFLTKNDLTTAASKILENFIAPYESFVTQQLKDNGYIMPFKTNLDEFAMGSSNETSYFGPVTNPWILKDGIPRVPGGSSGGSAACVAAYSALAATGSDTGGSVRQPASFCGVVGFKPSYGICSRRGIIAFASSLDCPGIFARNLDDVCIIMDQIVKHDPDEDTSYSKPLPKLTKTTDCVKGKRIGILVSAFNNIFDDYAKQLNNVTQELSRQGAIIEEIKLPTEIFDYGLSLYYTIATAEVASNLARFNGIVFGNRGEGKTYEEILVNTRSKFGKEVRRRILTGTFVLSSSEYDKFFGKAAKFRILLKNTLNAIFKNIDAILLPTTHSVPFVQGAVRDPISMYKEDLYTIIANIYGGPMLQIPFTKIKMDLDGAAKYGAAKDGATAEKNKYNLPSQEYLPIGIQIFSEIYKDSEAVTVAKAIEKIVQWKGLENV